MGMVIFGREGRKLKGDQALGRPAIETLPGAFGPADAAVVGIGICLG